jgi:hypothetical protein
MMAGEIGSVQDDDRVILGGNGGLRVEGYKRRGGKFGEWAVQIIECSCQPNHKM